MSLTYICFDVVSMYTLSGRNNNAADIPEVPETPKTNRNY
jgi:hypothetical protein